MPISNTLGILTRVDLFPCDREANERDGKITTVPCRKEPSSLKKNYDAQGTHRECATCTGGAIPTP